MTKIVLIFTFISFSLILFSQESTSVFCEIRCCIGQYSGDDYISFTRSGIETAHWNDLTNKSESTFIDNSKIKLSDREKLTKLLNCLYQKTSENMFISCPLSTIDGDSFTIILRKNDEFRVIQIYQCYDENYNEILEIFRSIINEPNSLLDYPYKALKEDCKCEERSHQSIIDEERLSNYTQIRTPGLLRIKTDILEQDNEQLFLLKGNKIVDSIFSVNNDVPVLSSDSKKIWSYYPENYIVIFEAFPIDNSSFYKVLVNNDTLLISNRNNITHYEPWQEHLKNSFILTTSENPVRIEPDVNSESLQLDYNEVSFEVIQVRGNWIYVKCSQDCEGCPNQKVIKGWLQWKENKNLKVEIRYVC